MATPRFPAALPRASPIRVRASDPAAHIVLRDVGANPLPHLTAETVAAIKGEPDDRGGDRGARLVRRAGRRAPGGRRHRHRQPDVQFRDELDPQGLVRPCAARRRHLPLHGGGAGRPAQGQEGGGDRKPRRLLQRGPGRGAGRPGAAHPHPARLHRARRRHLCPRREARLRPRSGRGGDRGGAAKRSACSPARR